MSVVIVKLNFLLTWMFKDKLLVGPGFSLEDLFSVVKRVMLGRAV